MSHARFIKTSGLSVSRAVGMVAEVVQEKMGRPEVYSGNSKYTCPSVSIGDWFQDPHGYQIQCSSPLYKMT